VKLTLYSDGQTDKTKRMERLKGCTSKGVSATAFFLFPAP